MAVLCSVCEKEEARAGGLLCDHRFCVDCFNRYVSGSLDELNSFLRCCICGQNSVLTFETCQERACLDFGRETLPKLADTTGLAQNAGGELIIADRHTKRVYVYDCLGTPIRDFAYLHGREPMGGVAVNRREELVLPFHDGKYSCLGFYRQDGTFINSCFLPDPASYVEGIAVTKDDWILASDSHNGQIHFINPQKRHVRSVAVSQQPGEEVPVPIGVAVGQGGDIFVTDAANHCVKTMDSEGAFKFSFGTKGQRPRQFNRPAGVTVDEEGRVVVADRGNHRAQYFTKYGEFIKFIVRYNKGDQVYMAPQDVVSWGPNAVALLLSSTREAAAAEVRIYKEWWPHVACVMSGARVHRCL